MQQNKRCLRNVQTGMVLDMGLGTVVATTTTTAEEEAVKMVVVTTTTTAEEEVVKMVVVATAILEVNVTGWRSKWWLSL